MNLAFTIDNRKCIGCHACTVACKSEHDIPLGVNRTWVKYVEKGVYPDTRRLFSVLRCNHCEDAPCIDICPTNALHTLDNGIVDFDTDRCIGCKSCMQACPYDALYINPETHVAEKCNFCAHRIEAQMAPACVIVCPVEAIGFGDISDPNADITKLIAMEAVTVRKAEKGTKPKVFYINGDSASLDPGSTAKKDEYMWSEQSRGVGHFAHYADQRSSEKDPEDLLVQLALDNKGKHGKEIQETLKSGDARRVYDSPSKGVLWGWEVSAYVWTKAISAGLFMVLALGSLFGWFEISAGLREKSLWSSMLFLVITGGLLVKDLDQPKRFLYVLLRPHWSSWLVKGAYFITAFGAILSLSILNLYYPTGIDSRLFDIIGGLIAFMVAIYTALLFAQAKGRDFWQSPIAPAQMGVNSLLAGTVLLLMLGSGLGSGIINLAIALLITNLLFTALELFTPHMTDDAKSVADMILKGRYGRQFWITIIFSRVVPLLLFMFAPQLLPIDLVALIVLTGILSTEHIWVRAPQLITLS